MDPIYGAAREMCRAITEASQALQARLNSIENSVQALMVVLYASHLAETSGAIDLARLTQAQEDLETFLTEIRPDLAQETE